MDRKEKGYGIGMLILDCLAVLEAVVGICKGEVTKVDLLIPLAVALALTIPFILWLRSRRKKK